MTQRRNALQPAEEPNTEDMIVVHRVFRRELRLLPLIVADVPLGDVRRARYVRAHAELVLAFLSTHHEGEDELLWPLLLQRAHLENALVLRMAAQHEVLHSSLDRLSALLEAWTVQAGEVERDELVAELLVAQHVLMEHLDEEERHVLPLVRRHLSPAEWARLAAHGKAARPRRTSTALMLLGAILEDADPAQRSRFLSTVPGPVRLAWHTLGQRAYRHHVLRLRRGRPSPYGGRTVIGMTEPDEQAS